MSKKRNFFPTRKGRHMADHSTLIKSLSEERKEKEKKLIDKVVLDFYTQATKDTMIGHHFRKIQEFESLDISPLTPPIEAFKSHLPRIQNFWYVQLLGEKNDDKEFQLLDVHKKLGVLPGEVGRWCTLFNEILEQTKKLKEIQSDPQAQELLLNWNKKINHFRDIFLSSPKLFGRGPAR